MKVDSKLFKGIAYVQMSELPQVQREIITQTINPDLFIKLLIDGKIISGCLQYKDYSSWYHEHFQGQPTVTVERPLLQPTVEIKPKLASPGI